MNCPTCGAPNVILHKDIWECGGCGDSGPIPCRILEQRKAAREKQEPLSDPCRADDFFEEIDFLWDHLAFDAEDFVPPAGRYAGG